MDIGVIIIFHNNEADIHPVSFIEKIKVTDYIKLCLVDNESKDETYRKLLEIKESCEDKVALIQVRKRVDRTLAKRAGARYMFNNFNLKHIGYIDTNTLIKKNYSINEILNSLDIERSKIIAFNKENKLKQNNKSSLFKSIFSILDYFKSQGQKENTNQLYLKN